MRERERGLYLPTPGMSRARADEAAAVMGFVWAWCEDVLGRVAEEVDARRKGSKCSFNRSNSSDSGAAS